MGRRLTLIRYDDAGNLNVGAAFGAMIVASVAPMTPVLLFAPTVLNGEY
jgi:hypothetical protein